MSLFEIYFMFFPFATVLPELPYKVTKTKTVHKDMQEIKNWG